MPLFVFDGSQPAPGGGGVLSSDSQAVISDLQTIVLNDNGIGVSGSTLGDQFLQVAYVPTLSSFGQAMISALIAVQSNVVILGVDSASVQSLGSPDGLGETWQEPPPDNTIKIAYDTTQCSGRGSFVFDTGGNKITDPTYIILYHELSHALNIANNTLATDPENQATLDENNARQEHRLPLRDSNNHGGGCN
jgi:hypothetical protein